MIFKKLKRFFNRDKRYRKRKFLGSVGLVLILVFGRPRLASDQSSNQNQNNQLAHERVIQNNELTIYDSEKPILHHQNVVNELRGGVNLTEAAWLLIIIWMLQQQSAGFQPVRQPPPPPYRQLFGGTSSLPRNNYFLNSGRQSTSLQMDRLSAMPHQEFTSLTKEQRRNLPDSKDRFINEKGHQDLVIRHGQARFKLKDHVEVHDLSPESENIDNFMASIEQMPKRKNIQWFDNGTSQSGTERGYPAVHIYDLDKQVIAVFQKSTGQFVTTCQLNDQEHIALLRTGNFGGEKNWFLGIIDKDQNVPKERGTNKDEL